LNIAPEVALALADNKPVVALESTIISHGLPRPRNREAALEFEQILRDKGLRLGTGVVVGVAIARAALAAALPALGAVVFVLMLVAAIALCLQTRNHLGAGGFAVMLLNVTLVRQSGYMGADLSWHLYHLFVATWLLCVARGFLKAPRAA
jgi:hypothetical protein